MGAAGVVGHHSPDGAPRMRRGIGTVGQTVPRCRGLHLIAEHTWFDARDLPPGIDLQDRGHPPRGVDDEALPDGIARHRRAPSAGDDGPSPQRCQLDPPSDVLTVAGFQHCSRVPAVERGVRDVSCPGHRVSAQPVPQLDLQVSRRVRSRGTRVGCCSHRCSHCGRPGAARSGVASARVAWTGVGRSSTVDDGHLTAPPAGVHHPTSQGQR